MTNSDLYAALTERLDYPGSARLSRILEHLMAPEAAAIAQALPGTAADVAERTGMAEEKVRQALEVLFHQGVVFPRGDYTRREYFQLARSVSQLHDASQAAGHLDPVKDRPFYELWQDFVMNEMYPATAKRIEARGKPFNRIVPAYKAIEGLPGVLPCEDYRELIKAQERVAVVRCSCRYRTTAVGEHCEHTSEEKAWHCLQLNRGAEYNLARGAARALTVDEAVALIGETEDDGLLHIWNNSTSMHGVSSACNCCRDCCMITVPLDQAGLPLGMAWEKSRYAAYQSSVADCTGCQVCVERCQFEAITMVQVTGAKKMKASVDEEKCFGCGVCVVGCSTGSLKMKVVRPPEHIPSA